MDALVQFLLLLVAVILYVMSMSMRSKKSRKNAYLLEVLSVVLIAIYVLPKTYFSFDSLDAAWGSLASLLASTFIICVLVNKLIFHKK